MNRISALLCSFLFCLTNMTAQQFVAVLQHADGEPSFFYGAEALKQALSQAANGDEILLSSGTYSSPGEITKAVRICGAGFRPDSVYLATMWNGDIVLNIPDTVSQTFAMEGIFNQNKFVNKSPITQIDVVKCFFGQFLSSSDSLITNINMINCYVSDSLNVPTKSSLICNNSVVCDMKNIHSSSSANITNCVLTVKKDDSIWASIKYSYIVNSLLCCKIYATGYSVNTCQPLHNTTIAYYCGTNQYNNPDFRNSVFDNQTNETNKYFPASTSNNSKPIKDSSDNSPAVQTTRDFIPSDAITMTGNDGTPIGVYGGAMPFTYVPSSRLISSYKVNQKTTEGKNLGVKITLQ